MTSDQGLVERLTNSISRIIAETNGIALRDTLELLQDAEEFRTKPEAQKQVAAFLHLLNGFQHQEEKIEALLDHPVAKALYEFFKKFPIPFKEEHIHLTGSLDAQFLFPRIKKLLEGPDNAIYKERIQEVYGEDALPLVSPDDVNKLIRLKEHERFETYLRILYLPKLLLTNRDAHREAAYHMAKTLYQDYNVGSIRLKFTLSRSNGLKTEQIPGVENVTEEDVLLGLYDGFKDFQSELSSFKFTLSPSFRKEEAYYDQQRFTTKGQHFDHQVDKLLELLEKNPFLKEHLTEIDTVGDEKSLYRKIHFEEMKHGIRRLQEHGFKVRSHHGETWKTLRKGIQSVDNAMNIWRIDTLEHGLSLGINPNYYFHKIYQNVVDMNNRGEPIPPNSTEALEVEELDWLQTGVRKKLMSGVKLTESESDAFVRTKFNTAREIESYQHDVLNRMIDKDLSIVALPTSNKRLTGVVPGYQSHPFSWWEKKGVDLGVGTDNYVTLDTDYLREVLILLFADADNLKITKLIMLITGETRRSLISKLLWDVRDAYLAQNKG